MPGAALASYPAILGLPQNAVFVLFSRREYPFVSNVNLRLENDNKKRAFLVSILPASSSGTPGG